MRRGQPRRMLFFAAVLAAAGCAGALEGVRQAQTYQQPAFIPEGLEQVVVEPSGVRWQVLERRIFAQVGDSVDLWVQRAEPDAPFAEPIFTGLVPSCFGRPRWVDNPDSGQREGACYLRRFYASDDALLFQLRLGGDWVTSASVPKAELLADDDGDGWSNATERALGTQPTSADSDRDGLGDSEDPNPLVPEGQGGAPAASVAQAMVQQAVSSSKACATGKPLIVVGADHLRQAFTGLACTVLWRAPSETASAARSGAGEASGEAATVDRLSVDMAAREGGISRLMVKLDDADPERPVVVVQHLLGTERVTFVREADRMVQVRRDFELRQVAR